MRSAAEATWNDEMTAKLTELWAAGLSASECGAELGGLSRNAVLGKVHRLKLPARRTKVGRRHWSPEARERASIRSLARERRKREAAIARVVKFKLPPPEALKPDVEVLPPPSWDETPADQRLSLPQLTEHTCKWPIGDPLEAGFGFCGQHSVDGSPYCAVHKARSIGQGTKREQRAVRDLREGVRFERRVVVVAPSMGGVAG